MVSQLDRGGRARGGSFHDKAQLPFELEFEILKKTVNMERWVLAGLAIATPILLTVPILYKENLSKSFIAASVGLGALTSGLFGAIALSCADRHDKYYPKVKKTHAAIVDQAMKQRAQLAIEDQLLEAKVKRCYELMALYPPQILPVMAKEAGVLDVMMSLVKPPEQPAIDVPAVDPSKVAPIAYAGQPTMKMVPSADELEESLNPRPPYRDLSVEIADYSGHIGYVSKTQSGKTSSMIRSIQRSLSTGKHVVVIDGKGDKRLREIQGVEYIHCNDKSKIPATFAVLDNILAELTARQDGRSENTTPIDLYIDEYNLIKAAAARYGKWMEIKAEDKWCEDCERILLQGAAAEIRLRASNHTSRCEDWGWNSGVLDSLSFVALGRLGAYESVEDLIKFQVSERLKPSTKEALERYRRMDFGAAPLVLTTLSPFGFCVLPTVDDSAIATPSSPTSFTFKTDPQPQPPSKSTAKTTHDPKIKPRDLDAKSSSQVMFEQFKAWYLANSPVDDETLRAKWLEARGEELTDHALTCLRELLERK